MVSFFKKTEFSDSFLDSFITWHYEDNHEFESEYRSRTVTGTGGGDINFAGTEVFKLFRGRVFNRRGYFGANAS